MSKYKDYGLITAKILQLLLTGFMIGSLKDRKMRRELYQECEKIKLTIDKKQLNYILRRLKLNNLIETTQDNNKKYKTKLTNKGKQHILQYELNNIKLKKSKKWDKKWRIVLFDVPEDKKKVRDALRRTLKRIGFIEFQKSVFVYPFSCKNEVNFIINFFDIYNNVYYIEAPISPDDKLRSYFKLK